MLLGLLHAATKALNNRIVNNLLITFYTLRAAEFKENLYFLIGGMGCTEPTVSEITAVYPNSSSTSTSCKIWFWQLDSTTSQRGLIFICWPIPPPVVGQPIVIYGVAKTIPSYFHEVVE